MHTCKLLNITITAANIDDPRKSPVGDFARKPLPALLGEAFGKVIADKGYVSNKLSALLLEQGIELITKVRKNMKEQELSSANKFLLRKRAIIESVIDQLAKVP